MHVKRKMSFPCHWSRKIAANQPTSGDRIDVSGVILSRYTPLVCISPAGFLTKSGFWRENVPKAANGPTRTEKQAS
jgi:hypothetical protein